MLLRDCWRLVRAAFDRSSKAAAFLDAALEVQGAAAGDGGHGCMREPSAAHRGEDINGRGCVVNHRSDALATPCQRPCIEITAHEAVTRSMSIIQNFNLILGSSSGRGGGNVT